MLVEDVIFALIGVYLSSLLIIWILLKIKGTIVWGEIKECNYVSETVMSNIKIEVEGKIIKSKKYGSNEVGDKVKLIKYKRIYVTEDLYSVMIPYILYVSVPLGILLIVHIFSP